MTKVREVEIVIQVDGEKRSAIKVKTQKSRVKSEVVELAKKDSKILKWVRDKEVKKTIFVSGKLINFVTK